VRERERTRFTVFRRGACWRNVSAVSTRKFPGVSGISLYVPRARVMLEDWCGWTNTAPEKVLSVVGRSFRVCGRDENAYTMAASAALRLILDYDVDPREVGYLALGTESSTDNAAGAVIVKGMIDQGLRCHGLPALARACEVPELKHACLGGVYATKAACRWAALEGRGRRAIVISSDVAEYARGSTGEPTQGAGAVAFLVEAEPKLFGIDLARAGNASSYRGVDFRKPFARHFMDGYAEGAARQRDFPVFNGKYSTVCYVDAVVHALDDLFARVPGRRRDYFESLAGVFFHRPYHHLPLQAFASALVWGLARDDDPGATAELAALCDAAHVGVDSVTSQLRASPDLFEFSRERGTDADPFREANAVVKVFRGTPAFKQLVEAKLALGAQRVRDLGNLYTASLPAWIGAGFEDAVERGVDLAGRELLAIGYGSGDAAEAIPLWVAPTWAEAARKIDFAHALSDAVDLDRARYEALHDGGELADLPDPALDGFRIDAVGRRNAPDFADIGIEYYRFARRAGAA
jgi:hydroxymethylglutaryl-CoA synthase